METVRDFIFFSSKITADGDCSHEIKRRLLLGRKAMTNQDSILKSRHYFADKGRPIKAMAFPAVNVLMWVLDHKESWAPKNWCIQTMVLDKTLESPLDCKEIKPVNPKGDQSWMFFGGTDAEVEAPILWPPDGKNWLTGKDPHAGKDRRWEEKGMTEDKMVGWHHRLKDMCLNKLREMVKDKEVWCAFLHGVEKSRTPLTDWTTRRELKIPPESDQGDKEIKNMKVKLRERKEERTGLNRYLMQVPKVKERKETEHKTLVYSVY